MTEATFLALVSLPAGLLCLAGGIMNWDWFMTSLSARGLVSAVGRRAARVIYVVMGLGFCAAAVSLVLHG